MFEIKDEEFGASKPLPLIIQTLLTPEKIGCYRFDAPYQRGNNIWSLNMKKNLIKSIFAHIPIGCYHSVAIDNHQQCNILDGKQRLTTIDGFYRNEFSVDWYGKEYKYQDLTPELKRKFLNFDLIEVFWEPMHILKQRDVFERINAMSDLKPAEKLYCNRFFCKGLISHIRKTALKEILKHIRVEVSEDKRDMGIKWAHNVCVYCFGNDLRGTFSIRSINQRVLRDSAKEIDGIILNKIGEQNMKDSDRDFISQDLLDGIGVSDNIKLLGKISDAVTEAVTYNNKLKKKLHSLDCLDLICFTMSHTQSGALTSSQIKSNKDKFSKAISEYLAWKWSDTHSQHQNTLHDLRTRYYTYEELIKSNGIDLGQKNKKVPDGEKSLALLDSDGKCGICGCELTDNNVAIDHKNPKSKHSQTSAGLVCKTCNGKKSNLDKEDLISCLAYINK